MTISAVEMKALIDFVYTNSGIVLDDSKAYLLESRLSPIIRRESFNGFGELLQKLKFDRNLQTEVIDSISTNETYFFRDKRPFELIKNLIVPNILGASGTTLKVWSAACSTGQEAYSIAIVLKELLFNFNTYNIQIHGSDISEAAVFKANQGEYSKFELSRGLDPLQVTRYFKAKGNNFKISDELRSVVQFRKENILNTRGLSSSYHIVLCRNVAIYFNKTDRIKLFEHIHKLMRSDGYLLIGSTENIPYASHLFKRESHNGVVYYRKQT